MALQVVTGPAGCGTGAQDERERRDAVNGPAQRGDLGEPLAAQVMAQCPAQRVESFVVVQDAFALPHVGRHPPSLGAHRPGALPSSGHLLHFAQTAGGAVLLEHPEIPPGP